MTGKIDPHRRWGPDTGDAAQFQTWDQFWTAYASQTRFIIQKIVDLFEQTEGVVARFSPTPYVSCLVKGCAEKGLDITQGGPELFYGTIEAVTYATTVDSLLAVKYLVYDKKQCSMDELIAALKDNWQGHEVLQAFAKNRTPKC
jgi:formate C-acetyltransferase